MPETTLHIKNMVCPRCITSVQDVFKKLNISAKSVALGEVVIESPLNEEQRNQLNTALFDNGFELLQDHKSKLISQIKHAVLVYVREENQQLNSNFSDILSDSLYQEYGTMSRLFSSVEGITIEKYILKQKVERVKELLFYDELTLSQIANQMHYSSLAHLSNQFKKETGMTPSAFKKLNHPGHQSLDAV